MRFLLLSENEITNVLRSFAVLLWPLLRVSVTRCLCCERTFTNE